MKNQSGTTKLILGLALIGLIAIGFGYWNKTQSAHAYYQKNILEPYERYQAQLKKELIDYQRTNNQASSLTIGSDGEISTNHFEGPEVHIEGLEHWGKKVSGEDQGVLDFSPNFMLYDPDHPSLGMPDIEVKVSPVKLYQPQQKTVNSIFAGLLPGVGPQNDRPYREYVKTVIPYEDSLAVTKVLMQVWLTEFEVTVGIRPDRVRKRAVRLGEEEKEEKIYPGKWYQRSGKLSADDLRAEPQNNRYGNVKLWLKINPNNSPWYVKNSVGISERPEMAIGAIYCDRLIREPVGDLNEIAVSVGVGSEMALYPEPIYQQSSLPDTVGAELPFFQEQAGTSIISRNDTSKEGIWNRPYYAKIFFKNIGSWKNGVFDKDRRYDDQLTYKFIMPILIEGTWDVRPPSEIIPSWEPPATFHQSGISLIPDFNLGLGGQIISFLIIAALVMVVLVFFVPGGLAIFTRIWKGLF